MTDFDPPSVLGNSWVLVSLQHIQVQNYRHPVYRLEVGFRNCSGSSLPISADNNYSGNFNSVQTRCIVKGEAQKSPLFWRFSGGFLIFSGSLVLYKFHKKTFKLNKKKSSIFTNAPCKTACLYNAPSTHTVNLNSAGADCTCHK